MSFFSKMTKEFEGMMKKDEKKEESPAPHAEATRGYGDQPQYGGYNQAPPQQGYGGPAPPFNSHPSYSSPPPNQYSPAPSGYGAPPPPQQYGSPAPSQYGAPPPAPYGSPAPQQYGTPGGLPPTPQVPQGWQPLWDPVGNRWAYLEQWNSKVNWNVPTGPSYPQQGYESNDASRGMGGYGDHGAPGGYGGYQQGYQQGGYQDPAKAKDDSKKNMMMGAAAGVAVGAVGGVLLANALGMVTCLSDSLPFPLHSVD
ncbi:hypothetical protein BKA64DRAFT_32696 [Cadophora sp. MPI-SDFR-AT-0126]|nr:hypothetical protein BKA64DRAFT_32696 [Leotiomycetes sp. MPI-SDFR-AT-0126]